MLERNYPIAGTGTREIAASVEALIGAGQIGAGERLPTVRELAGELGVSAATVAGAYRMLRERGLLEGAGRGGTRIRAPRPRSWRRSAPPVPAGVRNLAGGNPDPRLLPDLRPALAAVADGLDGGRAQLYGRAESLPALVDAFKAGFTADGVDTSHVLITGGALDGVARALAAHLRPGDRVAVEDPCYCGILDVLADADLQPEPVAIDDDGLLPDQLDRALASGARALVVVPRNHSPAGAAIGDARAAALRDVLARHPDVLVVEDDHGALIAETPLPALAHAGDRERWATVAPFAKALGLDLRLGALAADPLTARRIVRGQQAAAGWVSHLLQGTVLALLDDPATAALLEQARATYARRRGALLDALAEHGVDAHGRTGLNVWVPVADEATTAQALLARGWAVRGGEAFRVRSAPGLRITIADLEPEEAANLALDVAASLDPADRNRAA